MNQMNEISELIIIIIIKQGDLMSDIMVPGDVDVDDDLDPLYFFSLSLIPFVCIWLTMICDRSSSHSLIHSLTSHTFIYSMTYQSLERERESR